MLIKANLNEISNKEILHPLLRINKNINSVILDYRLRCRCFDNGRIPIKFLQENILVSKNSFIQNNYKLSNKIRKYVINLINQNYTNSKDIPSILGIGGEAYMYLLYIKKWNNNHFLKLYNNHFLTNNETIYDDAKVNGGILYFKLNLVNYNQVKIKKEFDSSIINLSKININLIKQINNIVTKSIIIISCNHNDFWKKSKYLTTFFLSKREKFIDEKLGYYLTVNLFIKKN